MRTAESIGRRRGTGMAVGLAVVALGMTGAGGVEGSTGPEWWNHGEAAAHPGSSQEGSFVQGAELQARIWLDRSSDNPYSRGERARVYYRVSRSAYVAIFRIDTDGRVDLLFPHSPYDDHFVRGGADYRLLFDRSSFWRVDDAPGLGYYFIVASPEPLDFEGIRFSQGGGWDLHQVGRTVYRDPYVAMDDYVATLIPDWEYVPYALDFREYNVERVHEYPRFVCYECHGYRPYPAWNPYSHYCTSFRVVIYNDPYYYPAYRYRGNRVVFVRPPTPRQPRFVFKERARGETGGPVVVRRPADGPSAGSAGPPRRGSPGADGVRRRDPTSPRVDPPGLGRDEGPSRRAGDRGRTPRATRDPVVVPPARSGGDARSGDRPVLKRRPTDGVRGRGDPGSGPDRATPRLRPPSSTGSRGSGGGSSETVRPPTRSGGNGSSTVRPRGSSGRSGTTVRPRGSSGRSGTTVRPRGSSGRSGAAVRSRGSSGRSGATVRSRGSSGSVRPPARTRSSGGSGAATRSRGSSGRSAPRVRPRGSSRGGAAVRPSRPPARTHPKKAPTKRGGGKKKGKKGGGGG